MSRLDRLDNYLDQRALEAVWFARPNTFSWLTSGSNVVSESAATGEAAAGYDGDAVTVVTNNIEAARLREEELAAGVDVETFEWHESSLAETVAQVSPEPAGADFDVPGLETVDVAPLRQPLTAADVDAYRSLGTATADAVEATCRDVRPSDTEQSVAARLEAELRERGCRSPVVLVGGSERASRYRHFPPTTSEVGRYLIVSVVAERAGLHASCTRTVAFDEPDWLQERHEAAMTVEVAALAACRSAGRTDGTAGEVFETIRRAYADAGYEGEWRHHHQGGAAGYDGREWFAEPESSIPVELPMAFAWNPTVKGAKSEGTVLVTDTEIEPLTTTGDWPTSSVTPTGYDVSVDRHEILDR